MKFLPALCPIPLTFGANWAIWIFGEMSPQVMLRELPLYVPVDFLHVVRVRDATGPSARPLHQLQCLMELAQVVLQVRLHRC